MMRVPTLLVEVGEEASLKMPSPLQRPTTLFTSFIALPSQYLFLQHQPITNSAQLCVWRPGLLHAGSAGKVPVNIHGDRIEARKDDLEGQGILAQLPGRPQMPHLSRHVHPIDGGAEVQEENFDLHLMIFGPGLQVRKLVWNGRTK